MAGMLFSWATEKGCGAGACDQLTGCDGRAFLACVTARRPDPDDAMLLRALRMQLVDGSATLGEMLRVEGDGACGARACDVRRGCDSTDYFQCLAENAAAAASAPAPVGGAAGSGDGGSGGDFLRSGVDFSHGFDEALRRRPRPAWSCPAAARDAPLPARPGADGASHQPAAKAADAVGKGVFAPHSLEPSAGALAERAAFEREIRASTDYIFGRGSADRRRSRTGRFPSLAGHGAPAGAAAAAADVRPATRAEVAAILRRAAALDRGLRGGAAPDGRPAAVVPWERAVRHRFPRAWREDTSRDRAANRVFRRVAASAAASSRCGTRRARAVAPDARLDTGSGGAARFVELTDVSGGDAAWRKMAGPGGRPYWLDAATGATQWDPPSLSELRRAERRILRESLAAGEVEGDPAQTVVPPAHVRRDLDALRSILRADSS